MRGDVLGAAFVRKQFSEKNKVVSDNLDISRIQYILVTMPYGFNPISKRLDKPTDRTEWYMQAYEVIDTTSRRSTK